MIIRYIGVCVIALCFMTYAAFSGVFGCAAPTAEEEAAAESFPETCAEAQEIAVDATGERPANGTYTLYVDGDESMPWDAYCYDMNRAEPKEFISVSELNNYSQITDATNIFETTYSKLRIDPIRLEVWPLDDTFATSDFGIDDVGAPTLPDGLENIPLGWAEFQVPSDLEMVEGDGATAEASLNLTDTGFVLDEAVEDDGYFCSVSSSDEVEQMSEGTGFDTAADLVSFLLTAHTTYPVFASTIREVADCTNLGADFDATTAEVDSVVIPLEYVGN